MTMTMTMTMTDLCQGVSRFLQATMFAPSTSKRRDGIEFAGESTFEVRRRASPLTRNMILRRGDSSSTAPPSPKNTASTTAPPPCSSLAWWLSSLVCGLSTALIYHVWIDYRRKEARIRSQQRSLESTSLFSTPDESSLDSYSATHCRMMNRLSTQSRRLVHNIWEGLKEYQEAWTHLAIHLFLGSFLWLLERSSNRQAPLVLGGGMLVMRQCSLLLLPSFDAEDDYLYGQSASSSELLSLEHVVTPYLFLYACPPTQRLRLWFAWVALKWVDLVSSKKTNIKTESDTTRGDSRGEKLEDERPQQTSRSADPSSGGDNASEGSTTTTTSPTRYLELMVHNVSHTDFVLSLDVPNVPSIPTTGTTLSTTSIGTTTTSPYCLCRPRFSFFDMYCRMALESLSEKDDDSEIVNFPRYQRALDDPRYVIKEEPTGTPIPTGFALKSDNPNLMADLCQVRVRGIDQAKVASAKAAMSQEFCEDDNEQDGTLLLAASTDQSSPLSTSATHTKARFPIGHVFFPLLATLLPHWQSQIAQKEYPSPVKRVLVLVTGVGTPRNFTHSLRGNSTQACAVLMERFLRRVDPGLTVVRIHSETNIFRYDDNLIFVERELMPVLNSYRDAHARGLPYPDEVKTEKVPTTTTTPLQPFNSDWRKSLSVYVSFADGSPARTYAIQASLRSFRPTYFHFWQLKTFWHESKIVDDDLEVHSFEAMETRPAVDTDRLRDPYLKAVVAEMKSFREDMVKTLQSGQHDIEKFWLRKTFKPVLAVLLVQSADMEQPIVYRGTNMEVSMPTGSLCAERNVIGTALAANPKLKREDLKMIAVLAVPFSPEVHVPDNEMMRINSTASFGSMTVGSTTDQTRNGRKISIGSEQDECASSSSLPPPLPPRQTQAPEDLASSFAMVALNDVIVDNTIQQGPATTAVDRTIGIGQAQQQQPQQDNSRPPTPVRKIALFSKSAATPSSMPRSSTSNNDKNNKVKKKTSRDNHQHRQQYDKRTVVVHPSSDMNPLSPCGACNEWLKKISESNPYFRVVTFTDANCNGVYCTNCQE